MNSSENYVQSTRPNVKTANQSLELTKSRFPKPQEKDFVPAA
jgi:hypothetical protein